MFTRGRFICYIIVLKVLILKAPHFSEELVRDNVGQRTFIIRHCPSVNISHEVGLVTIYYNK